MSQFKPIETIKSKLDNIAIKPGQMIYVVDTGETYYDDYNSSRVPMSDIIQLKTESERTGLLAPILNKIYLVLESNTLYRYNGSSWSKLNNNNPISFNQKNIQITSPQQSVQLGIDYNPNKDFLMVFFNSVFITGEDYNIVNNCIEIKDKSNWNGSTAQPGFFNFILIKNVK